MPTDWIGRAGRLAIQVNDLVDGAAIPGDTSGSPVIEKFSPRDGRLLCRFSGGGTRRIDEAVASARRAYERGSWAQIPAHHRASILNRLAALVDEHREELALLECLDVGKPITDALTVDIPAVSARIRFNAAAVDKFYGRVYASDASSLSYQLRRPYGVVAGVVGWNFPLVLAAEKAAPALAAGNSLVLKPSELTSLSARRLAELALEAGVPEGVFNVIHGAADVGSGLARHPDVDLISFTGSTRTGRSLLVAAGESNMKRTILECGGKAPNIVFEDCPDIDAVADSVLKRAFWNQGQVCTASSRLLVQRSVHGALMKSLIEKMGSLRTGDPLDERTRFGALVSAGHARKVQALVDSGAKSGARLVYRSSDPAPHEGGYYAPRVIFDEVPDAAEIAQQEIFGPVLAVMPFDSEADAIRIANGTMYGLSAILWTRDLARAHRLTQAIQAGWIVVNATGNPVGGPGPGVLHIGGLKQSGVGAEGGVEGLEAYTTSTAIQMYV